MMTTCEKCGRVYYQEEDPLIICHNCEPRPTAPEETGNESGSWESRSYSAGFKKGVEEMRNYTDNIKRG